MIYKNGLKDYFTVALFFGFFMGAYESISNNLLFGLITGIASALGFFALAIIFSKTLDKKTEYLRAEILKAREIICYGPASNIKGITSIGGYLFLSEDALEFYSHKYNFGGSCFAIQLDDIKFVTKKMNFLIVQTNEISYKFAVKKASLWKKSLEETI